MHRSRPSGPVQRRADRLSAMPRATGSPASFNALAAEQALAGDQAFVFDSTTSLTYAGFRDKTLRLAVGLRRDGVRPGDRVVVQLPNWTEFPVIAAALSRIGAILVPIMTDLPRGRGRLRAAALRRGGRGDLPSSSAGSDTWKCSASSAPKPRTCARCTSLAPPQEATSETPSLDSLVASGDLAALEEEGCPDSSPDDGFLIVYTWARRPGPGISTPSTPIARARARSSRVSDTPSGTCSSAPRL